MYKISYEEYANKVYGGWFGKCLGGAAGAPVEGFKKIIEVEDFRDIMDPNLPNDDLDLQLLWLDVLQKDGLNIDGTNLANAWMDKCHYAMMEYGIFVKNYERGIAPPYSGKFNNQAFSEGNGCPIRSEIWGSIFPGNAKLASAYAKMDGSLDHSGNSVWIEQFFAVMESMAFFINDIFELIQIGLRELPTNSKAYHCVTSMLDCHRKHPENWMKARTQALRLYAHNDFTNSVINLAFVMIGLLYGEGDLAKTVNIALKCGYDTDCTCATAAAIVGIIVGYEGIDHELKKLLDDKFVVGINIQRTNNTISYLTKETCEIGIEAARTMNKDCEITDIPNDIVIREALPKNKTVLLEVHYQGEPALGYRDQTKIGIYIHNQTEKKLAGTLYFKDVPEGWGLLSESFHVNLEPGGALNISNTVYTLDDTTEIHNTNILKAELVDSSGNGLQSVEFGIAGAAVWKVIGPFLDPLEKEDDPDLPSAHSEGCILPTLECMVNNAVYLDKKYVDEDRMKDSIVTEDFVIMNAHEDLLPIDQNFTFSGQGCFYLMQEFYSKEDREVWLVIGNNDGYKLWVNEVPIQEKDEIRLWTPYNNAQIVTMHKGLNNIIIKLLKRTELLKFSMGIRKYEGHHYHKNRWFTDFISKI